MKPDRRIVTKVPVTELWDDSGTLPGSRLGYLDQARVYELLLAGSVQFVVADCGSKLNWIPAEQRVDFWNAVRDQIADPEDPIYLDRFPNQTAYVASQWRTPGDYGCVILLEKHH